MTIVGRAQIDHPALGAAGGSALHASIETIYTNIGDDLGGRFNAYSSIANSALTTIDHNYGIQFSDMKIMLYTGSHPNLVRVSDPVASGWTIAATSGFVKTKIDVTAPGSGGPHTFAVFIAAMRGTEKLDDLDDVNLGTPPINGQLLIYDSVTSQWLPAYLKYASETATITTNTITPTTGTNLQRVTGTAADLQMIASPVSGKVYVLVNETGSDFLIKNDTGGTAANRFYTGTGLDFTLKSQAAVAVIYDSGLSRWLLTGGSGGGGLVPSVKSTTFTAVAGFHYLTNTSGGSYIATLPDGASGNVIMFSDTAETWDTFNLTLTPAIGEKIDQLAIDETLVCDVKRGWVELSWNSVGSFWSMRSLAATSFSEASATQPGIVSIGTQSFSGVKTFVDGIAGKTDGVAVAASKIGEVLISGPTTVTALAVNQFNNVASLALTAGNWLITVNIAHAAFSITGGTSSEGAVSAFSGNTTTDHVSGDNQMDGPSPPASNQDTNMCLTWIKNVSSTTTIYAKSKVNATSGTSASRAKITARRIA